MPKRSYHRILDEHLHILITQGNHDAYQKLKRRYRYHSLTLCRLEEYIPGSAALFDGWDGSENWVVYRGRISKYQLKKLEHWTGSGWEEVKLR